MGTIGCNSQCAVLWEAMSAEDSQLAWYSNMFLALQDIWSCIIVLHIVLVSDYAL